jgi:nucleolar protein 56
MKAYIVTTFIGCFAVRENKIVSYRIFHKDVDEIAEKLKTSDTELIKEETDIMKDLEKKGIKEIIFPFPKKGVVLTEPNSKEEQFIKENLNNLAVKYNFVKDQEEFSQFFSNVNIELTKSKIKKSVERDKLVIHINGAIEEIDRSLNVFIERLREIYGLHFPEMNRIINDHEKFLKIVETSGSRENIENKELKQLAPKSMGMNFRKEDVETVKSFAMEIDRLLKLKNEMVKYMENMLKEVAPNSTDIGGAMLVAKLISKAGGLEKLARMTSNTIQLLGSERALFRSLHSQGKIPSPKYGYIVTHSLVQNARPELRGKVARVLASKLSIAVKMDFYSKEYRGEKLKKELQERIKEILNK